MLTAEGMACRRGGRRLFHGLGFCLPPGGALVVIGANGCGKSSLLKTLAGVLPPEEGRVLWCGENAVQSDDFRHSLLYIGHQNALKPEWTVAENLRFWARMQGEELLLPSALHYWGLGAVQDMPCRALSAGWQRRTALARLLLAPRPLWLLDEPMAHLDAQGMRLLQNLVNSRLQQGGMIVLSSHQPESMPDSTLLRIEDFA